MTTRRFTKTLSLFLPAAALACGILAACGGGNGTSTAGSGGAGSTGSTGATGSSCFNYTTFQGATPVVSFKTDVLPIFRTSCGLSTSCHGTMGGGALPAQHYLGPSNTAGDPTADDIKAILAGIVGKPSVEETDMNVVTAGDPGHSYMTYKLDGVDCTKLKCAATKGCTDSMPPGSPLPPATRDIIRRWIAQGAKND